MALRGRGVRVVYSRFVAKELGERGGCGGEGRNDANWDLGG